jgi:hypothetical protein
MFSIFGGVGLIVLPYSLLGDFIYRPKKITDQKDFDKRKKVLLPRALKLRE